MVLQDLCSNPGPIEEFRRNCKIGVFNESIDNSVMNHLQESFLMHYVGTSMGKQIKCFSLVKSYQVRKCCEI